MKIFRFFLFAAVLSATVSLPADAPLIRIDEEEPDPVVEATGRLIELRDSNVDNRENTPPGVLAALVAANGGADESMRAMNIVMGFAVCALTIALGSFMIIRGSQKIGRMRREAAPEELCLQEEQEEVPPDA